MAAVLVALVALKTDISRNSGTNIIILIVPRFTCFLGISVERVLGS